MPCHWRSFVPHANTLSLYLMRKSVLQLNLVYLKHLCYINLYQLCKTIGMWLLYIVILINHSFYIISFTCYNSYRRLWCTPAEVSSLENNLYKSKRWGNIYWRCSSKSQRRKSPSPEHPSDFSVTNQPIKT